MVPVDLFIKRAARGRCGRDWTGPTRSLARFLIESPTADRAREAAAERGTATRGECVRSRGPCVRLRPGGGIRYRYGWDLEGETWPPAEICDRDRPRWVKEAAVPRRDENENDNF